MQETPTKVPTREKIAYGFGDLASVLYWQSFMLYFTYFYTDIFLISAGSAATLFLVTRLFDGINDPLMGMLADRTNTRWGKYRPYLLWFCVPFAIMGVLTFTVPDLSENGKLVWAYLTFIGIMMLYTIINIPYTALLGVISSDSRERTSIASYKFLFAFTAGIIVSATLLPMTKILGDGNDAQGWQYTFMIYGVAFVVFFLIAFKGTKERISPPPSQKSSTKKDLIELVSNKPWLALLAITTCFILFIAIRSSVTIHYFKYVIGPQDFYLPIIGNQQYSFEALASAFNTVNQIASLIGVLSIGLLVKYFDKKKIFIVLLSISAVSTASFYFLDHENLEIVFLNQFIYSITSGPLSVLLWSMYADIADYGEWKFGRRSTGLVFSASTMSQKFGWAASAWISLTLMASVGFAPNEAQSADSLGGLTLLFSLIPAGVGLLGVILMIFYPLNDVFVSQIEKELKQRRQKNTDNSKI